MFVGKLGTLADAATFGGEPDVEGRGGDDAVVGLS